MNYLKLLKLLALSFVVVLFSNCEKEKKENYIVNIENNNTQGTISVDPAKSTYDYGDRIFIEATPKEGFDFHYWEGDVCEENKFDKVITIVIDANIKLEAIYIEKETVPDVNFSLIVNCNPDQGSVEISPQKDHYNLGETVFLKANPLQGYSFVRWEGGCIGTSSEVEIEVTKNLDIKCVFQQNEPTSSAILFQLEGLYQDDENNWEFTATIVNNSNDAPCSDFEVQIDGEKMGYNDFFEQYELQITRDDNNSVLNIEFEHPDFGEHTYSISPSHFPPKGSLTYNESDDSKSFALNWLNVNSDNYQITKKLFSQNTSAEVIVAKLLTDTSYVLVKDDIWNSNAGSSEPFETFWVWVNPVVKIDNLGDQFSEESYIEIIGRRSAVVEGTR